MVKIDDISDDKVWWFYNRNELDDLFNAGKIEWYSTVNCAWVTESYEAGNLRIPLAWLCEHTNDMHIKEKTKSEYKENIIDFQNYKLDDKNIDELFSIPFSKILSAQLSKYIQFTSRDTDYNAENAYGKKRNYTAEAIRKNFEKFVSVYFSNKNKDEKYNWINNVDSLKEIYKLYILFTAASINEENAIFNVKKKHTSDEAVTGILEKVLNSDRDMTSVFMIDNTAYISQNSFYLEKLYSALVTNLQFTIDDFIEIAIISKYINDSLNQMVCFNYVINDEQQIIKPICQFNYKYLEKITSPKISFIILINILCKKKYLNINFKLLNYINQIKLQNNNFEKIYALKDIASKIDAYYNYQNTNNLNDLFKSNKILTLKEQNLLLDFILPDCKEYKQKKQKVGMFDRHINYINAIYMFMMMKRQNYIVSFFDILYISFIYFRLYKNILPLLKQYQTKRNNKSVDGIWKEIINNEDTSNEWLYIKYAATLFEPYYMIWERIRTVRVDSKTWEQSVKQEITLQLENYYTKNEFLDSIIKKLKKW